MDSKERVILYDGLVNISLLEKLFNREIIVGLEQLYSYELKDNKDILKSFGLTWILYKNVTCYLVSITEEELELLDDWYSVPLLSKRTLIIALGKLCWIYYNNNYNLRIGESNLNIFNQEELKNKVENFIVERRENKV